MAPDEPTIEPWDSFGQELYAYWQGDPDAVEIIERCLLYTSRCV